MKQGKSFAIPKNEVWRAWKRVKSNKGGPGADGISIQDYERECKDNLYKLWNRMSSGSYMAKPVQEVQIDKEDGGKRILGVPTVEDRIAQQVCKQSLEPVLEKVFHPDSYGYRPKRSQHQALEVVRKRSWKYAWVIDLDIKSYFDSIDHELLMKAVRHHTEEKWILLYVERWLEAPMAKIDGTQVPRAKGTPQGGVISPLLSNLFLHYAHDNWMANNYPNNPFARYADDLVIHCRTKREAEQLLRALTARLKDCGLEIHPQKTKIVYCKDQEDYTNIEFDFLGFTFRPRAARSRSGGLFRGFLPAISGKRAKKVRQTMRGWNLHRRTGCTLTQLAEFIHRRVLGWINYYGKYYKSELCLVLKHLNRILIRWACRRFKKLKGSQSKARVWLRRVYRKSPELFVHWQHGVAV